MTLRPEYLLGHSAYNEFLYASVGHERNGGQLTVLSALARLGFDPWQEAARLSDLPREAAARALAATIAVLPEGDWKASDAGAIAARLVNWLPGRSSGAVPSLEPGGAKVEKPKSRPTNWLLWGALALAFLVLMLQLQP